MQEEDKTRRKVLIGLTSAVGLSGLPFAATPFIAAWNPSAKAKAAESASDTSEFDGLGTTDLLKIGIRTRLEYNVPHVRTWSQAMALGATTPQNVANTAEAVGAIADEIWHCAGDMSADTSWYTKRAVGKLSA